MKRLLTLLNIGFACSLSAAETTNAYIVTFVVKDNGNVQARTNELRAGELLTVKSLVATNNLLALTDTNLTATTEQKFITELCDERIKRLRVIWLREKRGRLTDAINRIESDADLEKVATEANKYVP